MPLTILAMHEQCMSLFQASLLAGRISWMPSVLYLACRQIIDDALRMFSSFSFCFASLFAWQLSDAQCFIPFPQARQLRGERARDLVYRTEKEDDQTVALDQTVAACGDCLTSDSYDSQDPKKNQSPARMRLIFRT